jgi:hypothetical protein
MKSVSRRTGKNRSASNGRPTLISPKIVVPHTADGQKVTLKTRKKSLIRLHLIHENSVTGNKECCRKY